MALERVDLRGMIRTSLSPEQNALIGDEDINNIINKGIVQIHRDCGGVMTSTDIATNSDGIASLPDDCIRVHRVVYDDTRMKKIDLNDI